MWPLVSALCITDHNNLAYWSACSAKYGTFSYPDPVLLATRVVEPVQRHGAHKQPCDFPFKGDNLRNKQPTNQSTVAINQSTQHKRETSHQKKQMQDRASGKFSKVFCCLLKFCQRSSTWLQEPTGTAKLPRYNTEKTEFTPNSC